MKANVILELIRAYGDAMLSLGNHAAHHYADPGNPATRRLAERASDEATQLRRDIECAILGLSERAEALANASRTLGYAESAHAREASEESLADVRACQRAADSALDALWQETR